MSKLNGRTRAAWLNRLHPTEDGIAGGAAALNWLLYSASATELITSLAPLTLAPLGLDARARLSLATRAAFSNCATAPRIWRTMMAVGVSSTKESGGGLLSGHQPKGDA